MREKEIVYALSLFRYHTGRNKRVRKKIQGIFQRNLPFVLVFMVALIWHLVIKISAGDDVVYFQTLMDGRSIWEILAHRYATWSSRMAIEFVLIPLVQVSWLWKILDIIIYTLIPVLLYRLLNNYTEYIDEYVSWSDKDSDR